MPRPLQYFEKFDPITADFTYVRWLGDRKEIELQTRVWDKIVVDRRAELSEWANILEKVHLRKIPRKRATLGADKNYDTQEFVAELCGMNITPHVAQNDTNRRSAVDERTTRHAGYEVSQRKRKRSGG